MYSRWPVVFDGCTRLGKVLIIPVLIYWKNCLVRGINSLYKMGSVAMLVMLWSYFLSLTSMSVPDYSLISMGVSGFAVQFSGHTSGIFIAGIFAISVLCLMYVNFWLGTVIIVGGYLSSLNHAQLVSSIATAYAINSVKLQLGWLGVFLSINLAFLSNDIVYYYMSKFCNESSENTHLDEHMGSELFTNNNVSMESEYSALVHDDAKLLEHFNISSNNTATTSSIVEDQTENNVEHVRKEDTRSIDEIERILDSQDHYETLGVERYIKIDDTLFKKEYMKRAMLVHPDKNSGSLQASEAFKKLQCAYEVLSNPVKKRDYDYQLRKEEEAKKQNSHDASHLNDLDHCLDKSRNITCKQCGKSHTWNCTKRSTANARWCKDCREYHRATDGDGWIECRCSMANGWPENPEIHIFVCAESKVFEVTEWAFCQGGIRCWADNHKPGFQVSGYPLDIVFEMSEEEKQFSLQVDHDWASGCLRSTRKDGKTFRGKKSWNPFQRKIRSSLPSFYDFTVLPRHTVRTRFVSS